jgi:hypothetical protein
MVYWTMTDQSKPGTLQERWLDHTLDQWAERIHRSGLDVVALPLLEVGRGLGGLASHALLFVEPLLNGVVDRQRIAQYVALLEDPSALESLIRRIERRAARDG